MHTLGLCNVDRVTTFWYSEQLGVWGERVLIAVAAHADADFAGVLYVSCTPCSTLKMHEVGLGSDLSSSHFSCPRS